MTDAPEKEKANAELNQHRAAVHTALAELEAAEAQHGAANELLAKLRAALPEHLRRIDPLRPEDLREHAARLGEVSAMATWLEDAWCVSRAAENVCTVCVAAAPTVAALTEDSANVKGLAAREAVRSWPAAPLRLDAATEFFANAHPRVASWRGMLQQLATVEGRKDWLRPWRNEVLLYAKEAKAVLDRLAERAAAEARS